MLLYILMVVKLFSYIYNSAYIHNMICKISLYPIVLANLYVFDCLISRRFNELFWMIVLPNVAAALLCKLFLGIAYICSVGYPPLPYLKK